jgi:hypothetical protein
MTNTDDWGAALTRIEALAKKAVTELDLPPERPVRKAPALDMTPARTGITAGALIRRQVRRELMSLEEYGITFKEEKGLIDSNFYIRGPRWAINTANNAFAAWFERLGS